VIHAEVALGHDSSRFRKLSEKRWAADISRVALSEQDHRGVKQRYHPILSFGAFHDAYPRAIREVLGHNVIGRAIWSIRCIRRSASVERSRKGVNTFGRSAKESNSFHSDATDDSL